MGKTSVSPPEFVGGPLDGKVVPEKHLLGRSVLLPVMGGEPVRYTKRESGNYYMESLPEYMGATNG